MFSRNVLGVLLPASFVLAAVPARGGDFFGLSAVTTSGTPQTITTTGSSLIDLADNLIKTQSQFLPLIGKDFTASLTYGGVPNSLLFSENAAGTSATLNIPATGFSRTFTGNNRNDVEKQIEDFIKKNGATEYGRFLKSLNQTSPVSLIDGNPQSFTAMIATDAFTRFGLYPTLSTAQKADNNDNGLRFDVGGGSINTNTADGYYATAAVGFDIRFNDHVALTLATPFEFRQIGGSDTYSIASELGLPITIFNITGTGNFSGQGLAWQVTPWGLSGISGSVDQVSGAVLVGGGLTSSLDYKVGDFIFTLADQFDYAHGIPVSAGNYRFDTDVDQPILKNGVKLTWTPGTVFFADAGVSYSNFLRKAAVQDYWTPTAGIGFRFDPDGNSGLRIGYSGDFGPKSYVSTGGLVTLFFNY